MPSSLKTSRRPCELHVNIFIHYHILSKKSKTFCMFVYKLYFDYEMNVLVNALPYPITKLIDHPQDNVNRFEYSSVISIMTKSE